MATRNLVINDPVGIHARPAAQFAQAVTASNCNVTIAKEGGDFVKLSLRELLAHGFGPKALL